MRRVTKIADGLYRLVKWKEDHNPVFPSRETIVEVKGDDIINVSTQRRCHLNVLDSERSLFGPLANAYDIRPVESLQEIRLVAEPDDEAEQSSAV